MCYKLKKLALFVGAIAAITLLVMTVVLNADRQKYRGNSGTDVNGQAKIKLHTIQDYMEFAKAVSEGESFADRIVILQEDLDFTDCESVPVIGNEEYPFEGVFDGNGHHVFGMKIVNPEGTAGMFGALHGTVKNLCIEDGEFYGKICGAIAADSYYGAILNCEIDAKVQGEVSGSIVGRLHGNLWNCVSADENFAGQINKGSIEFCFKAGTEELNALNENLSHLSGFYGDTDFCLWESDEGAKLSQKQAELPESFTARMNLNGNELKLKGYYSANDRKWCFALPAKHKDAVLTIDAVSSRGKVERFQRANGEETIVYTGNHIYYPIDFLCADNIDTFYITLENQKDLRYVHENKTEEIPGILTIMDSAGNVEKKIIKGFYGHGNDSWASEKKSYNLKFDTAQDILGMGENEDFALLACYRDNSLMCYTATTELIRGLEFEYPPQFRFVNLYVGGEYAGVYFLAEKVELDENRIEISNIYEKTKLLNHNYMDGFALKEWKDVNSLAERYYYDVANDPEDLTGGYLLEADIMDYEPEESRFVSERGIPMTMKRARYSSEAQVNYIADYWQEFEDALFSATGKNAKGKHYTEYIDAESFAMQWLMYELVQEGSMSSSIYFYKESEIDGDGLLHACFPWDMEHSYVMSDKVGDIWNITEKAATLYGYWNVLYSHEDFRGLIQDVWKEKFVPAIETMIAEEAIETSTGMKNLRWYEEHIENLNHLENSRWRKMHPLNRCQMNREFLSERMKHLSVLLFEA